MGIDGEGLDPRLPHLLPSRTDVTPGARPVLLLDPSREPRMCQTEIELKRCTRFPESSKPDRKYKR